MPCIHIRSKEAGNQGDLKSFAYDLSQEMNIDIERINILVDFYDESRMFIGSNIDHLIITLWISEKNDKQFIYSLVKTIATLGEKYFNKEGKSTAVMCNLVGEGYLFINNQFK